MEELGILHKACPVLLQHPLNRSKSCCLSSGMLWGAGKERGWGLRCARDMRSGEFVCEYAGEVITTEEAVRPVPPRP